MMVQLLQLPDALLVHVFAHTRSFVAIGRVGCVSHRLRRLVSHAGGCAFRLLRAGPVLRWEEAPTTRSLVAPGGARALALADGWVLYPCGDADLTLVRAASSGGTATAEELTIRDAAACAQAACGDVGLSLHRVDSRRHGSVVLAPRRALARGERTAKVRSVTLSGRNRRSVRVGGALSAIAVGGALVATARRGASAVQLWHAESGAPATPPLGIHGDGATITSLSWHGNLLLSTSDDGSAALHAIEAAAAPPPIAPPVPAPPATSGVPAAAAVSPASIAARADAALAAAAGAGAARRAACVLRVRAHSASATTADLGGSWLVSGGADALVAVSIVSSGKLAQQLRGHRAPLVAVRVASARVLGAAADGALRVWDGCTGTCITSVELLARVPCGMPEPTASVTLLDLRLSEQGVLALSSAGVAYAFDWPADADTDNTSADAAGDAADAAAPPSPSVLHVARPAPIFFPVACVQEQLSSFAPRLSDDAPEYMAAVLQVVAAQVLERAGDAALERHSGRIAPREIREAVRRDGELAQLVGDEALAEGGLLGSQPLGVDSDTLRAAAEGEAALDSAAVSDAAAGLAAPPPPPPAEAAFDAALPLSCVQEQLSSFAPRLSDDAPEYMAAVLQVVAAQVLERAGDAALEGQSGRIAPHHIRQAVRRDGELTQLVGDEAMQEGGMLRPSPAESGQPPE